ncbi:hypothetical protein CORC01_11829 [Colletotrichum orchidophilum]|uniref:Peptidase A1 domain-containing protein n=1 Tax=Colletotrichum orchidophilum TaxID=1209926 RepID=A0A1G4AUP3_9PEZI|nr:uncharacterized protein CORC01_11829 [Colletotrichum orchidophilum]OHE92887.1 hypothetical protein CORC01_11829 [Colletotrichum orchidophilum]
MQLSKFAVLLPLLAGSTEAGKMRAPRSWAADRFDMQLTWNQFGFLSHQKIGNPPQEIPIFVDWTWISQYILSPKCYGEENDPAACLNVQQLYYDPAKSTSHRDASKRFPSRTWLPNHFFFWEPLTVDYAQDAVQIGPVTSNSIMQFSDTNFDLSAFPYPFTGVLGLSPVFKGDNASLQSPFYQQWKAGQWKNPTISFVYCYEESMKATCNGSDGLQSFGGIMDQIVKDSEIYWYANYVFPDVNTLAFEYHPGLYNYWATPLDSLWIGDELQPTEPTSNISGKASIFDHASYGRGIPLTPNAYEKLVNLTGGQPLTLEDPTVINNGNQSMYSVDCGSVGSFPTVSYKFAGHDKVWANTPKHYVETLPDGTCALNVRAMATGDRFIGNFGETFFKDKVAIMNFETLQVGIAEIQW